MDFSELNRTIVETNSSYSFALSPTPFAAELAQSGDLPNSRTGRKRRHVGDFPKNLKVHEPMVANSRLGVNENAEAA